MVVPIREQMKKSGYSLDSFLFTSDREVVVEAFGPFLQCAVPPFDVIPYSECLPDTFQSERFERIFVPRRVIHDHERFVSAQRESFFRYVDRAQGGD